MTDPAVLAERLLASLPEPRLHATIAASGMTGLHITLDGPESPLARVLGLALLADTIGDDEGPERTATGRYACGVVNGVTVLVEAPVTPAEQRDLERLCAEMVDGFAL